MHKTTFTCPFTGCDFDATIDKAKNIYVKHPITDEIHLIKFDAYMECYEVPEWLFEFIPTVTPIQAAEILEVTRQRISAIATYDTIPAKTVNGQTVFTLDDVLKYKETRKTGAPRKDV